MAATPAVFSDKNQKYIFDGAKKEEQQRLERQSESINILLHSKPFRAPLDGQPTKILEIGCGTGMMTSRLGQLYPSSKVYGIDPTPVPDIHSQPPNVEYIQDTFEDLLESGDPRLEAGTFDYVFTRMLLLVVSDWSAFFSRVKKILKPGGWVEVQEMEALTTYADEATDSTLAGERVDRGWGWLAALHAAFAARGFDLDSVDRMKETMYEAGLTRARDELFRMPIAPHDDDQEETRPIATYLRESLPLFTESALKRFLSGSHSEQDIDKFKQQAWQDMWPDEHGANKYYWWFHVIVGQKAAER